MNRHLRPTIIAFEFNAIPLEDNLTKKKQGMKSNKTEATEFVATMDIAADVTNITRCDVEDHRVEH